jgi:hypothetical protein
MLLMQKTLPKTTDRYKVWNDRIYRARFKINKGYITILRLHVPEDGRNEEADRFYQQLQEITDKINKNNYIL